MSTSNNTYDTTNKTIHDSVIKGFKEIGAPDAKEINSFGSLDKTHFTEINNPTISSQNGYNASLSFSKKNIHTHIGFSKSITFGDSYSIRHRNHQDWNVERKVSFNSKKKAPEPEEIKHTTFVSSNTADFTVGDSDSTTSAKYIVSKYNKGICYLQKGTTHYSNTTTVFYNQARVAIQGNYYKKYTTNTITNTLGIVALSFNLGLVSYGIRLTRFNIYLMNYNTNDFLASSRIAHLFLTGVSDNIKGQRVTATLFSERWGWSKCLGRVYSKEYCLGRTNVDCSITTNSSTAGFAKVIFSSMAVKVLKKNNFMMLA